MPSWPNYSPAHWSAALIASPTRNCFSSIRRNTWRIHPLDLPAQNVSPQTLLCLPAAALYNLEALHREGTVQYEAHYKIIPVTSLTMEDYRTKPMSKAEEIEGWEEHRKAIEREASRNTLPHIELVILNSCLLLWGTYNGILSST